MFCRLKNGIFVARIMKKDIVYVSIIANLAKTGKITHENAIDMIAKRCLLALGAAVSEQVSNDVTHSGL